MVQSKKDLSRIIAEKSDLEETYECLKRDHSQFRRNVNSKLEEFDLIQASKTSLERKVEYLNAAVERLSEENDALKIRIRSVESENGIYFPIVSL